MFKSGDAVVVAATFSHYGEPGTAWVNVGTTAVQIVPLNAIGTVAAPI